MAWHFVPGLEPWSSASGLPWDGDTAVWVTSNATPTQQPSSWRGWKTRSWIRLLSGTISRPSTAQSGVDAWISSLRVSRASLTRPPARDADSRIPAGSGTMLPGSFARYDPSSSSWRTSQACLPLADFQQSSVIWPKSGSMRNGSVTARRKRTRPTSGIGCGYSLPTPVAAASATGNRSGSARAVWRPSLTKMASSGLWPTPTAGDGNRGVDRTKARRRARGWNTGETLIDAVHRCPTPTTGASSRYGGGQIAQSRWATPTAMGGRGPGRQDRDLTREVGGRLNPTWVEWLMGWPLGWTDCERSGTVSSLPQRRERSSNCMGGCSSEGLRGDIPSAQDETAAAGNLPGDGVCARCEKTKIQRARYLEWLHAHSASWPGVLESGAADDVV